jgi:chromosome segregation and condensation protein ScpB
MSRRPKALPYDRALDALPPERRWREWMARVEAVIFAAPDPVPLAVLRPLVGDDCRLDALIADIRAELAARPYDLVFVAGGWHHRTRRRFAGAIRAAGAIQAQAGPALSEAEHALLAAIAYHQPLTRAALSRRLGIAVSRDSVARLKHLDLIGAGPRARTGCAAHLCDDAQVPRRVRARQPARAARPRGVGGCRPGRGAGRLRRPQCRGAIWC